jgi:riboflavin biosynthesis pyrimidine reductase
LRLLLPDERPLDPDDLHDLYDTGDEPCLRAGFVLSADGGVAHDGGSRPLQTPADEAVFHALRAVSDAVVVGAGTARAEGYGPVRPRAGGREWRRRHRLAEAPTLVLVSRSLDLDPADRCFTGSSLVVTSAASDPDRRAQLAEVTEVVVAGDDDVDLRLAVRILHERGLTRLLCEGGPSLLAAVLRQGLLDELCLTLTPLLLGSSPQLLSEALAAPRRLDLLSLVDGGRGVLLARYSLIADA